MRRVLLIIAALITFLIALVFGIYIFTIQSIRSDFVENDNEIDLIVDTQPVEKQVNASVDGPPPGPVIELPNLHQTGQSLSTGFIQPLVRYPARIPDKADRSGRCTLLFNVDKNGNPFNIKAETCTHRMFEIEAIRAVSKYQYRPKIIDGMAVEIRGVTDEVKFLLTDEHGNILPE